MRNISGNKNTIQKCIYDTKEAEAVYFWLHIQCVCLTPSKEMHKAECSLHLAIIHFKCTLFIVLYCTEVVSSVYERSSCIRSQLQLLTCHVLTVCNQIKVLHACLLVLADEEQS